MSAFKCFYCQFVKRLALQNTKSTIINNGVIVLNPNSEVPIKTRFARTAICTSEMSSTDVFEKNHIVTVETELKVTQGALDVHMGCTPFVKD